MMQDYNKAPLTYAQQVALLQTRGLTIQSPANAIIFLQQVSYYRFSAYCIPFQNPRDVFTAGSTFEQIVELYRLDGELCNVLLALLSPVEIYLRTHIVYELSHKWGPFAHYDSSIFRDQDKHVEWIASLEEEVNRRKETFLDHYRAKYNGFPRLPLWMACEIMSMGNLSQLYSTLLTDIQLELCNKFGIRQGVMRSWMHVITYLRNICAHHNRLWNRELAIRPYLPDKDIRWTSLGLNNQRLFASVAVAEWICLKALIPVSVVDEVHAVMRKISAIDTRFAGMMGVPTGRAIGMCWGSQK